MLDHAIRSSIRRYDLLHRGDRVILGVSGGPDSMALLLFFLESAENLGVEFAVAHLDHGKRGRESEEDQRFVQAFCQEREIPVFTKKIDLPSIMTQWGGNTQEVARRYRYEFFEQTARQWQANVVATAHTASDVVETFLMNLLRGTGTRGLGGIPPCRLHKNLRVIRPLIQCSRGDILLYLRSRKVSWREDSSNLSDEYSRNRIRNKLIPFLRENFSGQFEETILTSVDILREEDAFLDLLCYASLEEMKTVLADGAWSLDLQRLRAHPLALRRRILRQAIRSCAGDPEGERLAPDFTAIDALIELAARESSGARVDLAGGMVVERSYEGLIIYPPAHEFVPLNVFSTEIKVPGTIHVAEAGLSITAGVFRRDQAIPIPQEGWRAGRSASKGALRAFFDADKLSMPLIVRTRQPGDRIHPLGMEGTKKVHDIFIDEKIPKGERNRIPIVADQSEVLWVVGVKQSEAAKVTESTETILSLEATTSVSPEIEDVIA